MSFQLGDYVFSNNKLDINTNAMKYYGVTPIRSECVTGIACDTCLAKFNIKFLHVPGDVYLGGFFNVHHPGRTAYSCGDMKDFNGFQFTEAMAYAVDLVNKGNGPVRLNGVKLGAIGLDDCSNSYFAKNLATGIHSGSLKLTKDGVTVNHDKIQSWLTYGSGMSVQIAQILNALQMPQISPSATSTTLSNVAAYPAFYRTVPSDKKQVAAMAKLASMMKWTCVQTVHEPSVYGRTAIIDFKAAARKERICVSACYELTKDGSYNDIVQKLSESSTKAVIVFARSDSYARHLLAAKAANSNATGLVLIASESWGNLKSVIKGHENAAEGFITFKVNAPVLNEFNTYMGNLKPTQNKRNPWFDEYYQQLYQCNLPGGYKYQRSCVNPGSTPVTSSNNYEQENWVVPTVDAVFAFTQALDGVLKDVCGSTYSGKPCLH